MGGSVQSYQDLIAWQKAYALGLALYRLCAILPEHERFGLTAALRRSSLLVARLIAEGFGKGNALAYAQMLRNARSATYDIDTQIMFTIGLSYATRDQCEPLIEQTAECGKVISGLIKSVENSAA